MGFYNRYNLFNGCGCRERRYHDYDDYEEDYGGCDDRFDNGDGDCYQGYEDDCGGRGRKRPQGRGCKCIPWQGNCREENRRDHKRCEHGRHDHKCCPICNFINMICK